MDYRILGLPFFTVLGRLASGTSLEAPQWVPRLWGETFQARHELSSISLGECWGLMGTPGSPLSRWNEQGTYLAGWEVERGTAPPAGWEAWEVPASAWIRVAVTAQEIAEGHEFLGQWLRRQEQWMAVGASHEHYPASFRDPESDRLHLCQPLAPRPA